MPAAPSLKITILSVNENFESIIFVLKIDYIVKIVKILYITRWV